MIESVSLSGVATFAATPTPFDGLSQFNYVYGSNGTGKTTLGRVIANEGQFPTCQVTWKAGVRLQSLVYNYDFVERNFNASADLKGVFTLGEKQVEALDKIATAKKEIDALAAKITSLTDTLQGADGQGGKLAELAAAQSAFKERCWKVKQKHDAALQGAFEGFRNSKDNFRDKVLEEEGTNVAVLLPFEVLSKKAASLFGSSPSSAPLLPSPNTASLAVHESHPILGKRVVGRQDVDIAAMIQRLSNSDWVRQGRQYFDANENTCPFCQQATTDAFAQSLTQYFDDSFAADTQAIEGLVAGYAASMVQVLGGLDAILSAPSRFLDAGKLQSEVELLRATATVNRQRLATKQREASSVVELEATDKCCGAIAGLIQAANEKISAHNAMVANLASERGVLRQQVWRFVLEEMKEDLAAFKAQRVGLTKGIAAIRGQIDAAVKERAKKEAEVRSLEKQTTSIQPTIDGINQLLSSFGFQGFKLAKAAGGSSYKLVRVDGSDAKATLSEGEKTFVTFLYFYHLLKGSESESGMTTDRIVVFDDPVSSLDSDVLFVVGSLIRGLCDEVRSGIGHIKQVFILTHNVYFHKEVSYNSKRRDIAMKDETFWVVRKAGAVSRLEKHPGNPIKTSYELLWAELRRLDRSNVSIQNTLRRILENYFKILGGIDFEELCGKFEGKEQLICKSLCSWIHDGSHYAHDDLYVAVDDSMVDAYLSVFKAIFDRNGHGAHYRMMMGTP